MLDLDTFRTPHVMPTGELETMLRDGWVPIPEGGFRHLATPSDPDHKQFLDEDVE